MSQEQLDTIMMWLTECLAICNKQSVITGPCPGSNMMSMMLMIHLLTCPHQLRQCFVPSVHSHTMKASDVQRCDQYMHPVQLTYIFHHQYTDKLLNEVDGLVLSHARHTHADITCRMAGVQCIGALCTLPPAPPSVSNRCAFIVIDV